MANILPNNLTSLEKFIIALGRADGRAVEGRRETAGIVFRVTNSNNTHFSQNQKLFHFTYSHKAQPHSPMHSGPLQVEMLYQRYFLRMNQSNTTHILALLLALIVALSSAQIVFTTLQIRRNFAATNETTVATVASTTSNNVANGLSRESVGHNADGSGGGSGSPRAATSILTLTEMGNQQAQLLSRQQQQTNPTAAAALPSSSTPRQVVGHIIVGDVFDGAGTTVRISAQQFVASAAFKQTPTLSPTLAPVTPTTPRTITTLTPPITTKSSTYLPYAAQDWRDPQIYSAPLALPVHGAGDVRVTNSKLNGGRQGAEVQMLAPAAFRRLKRKYYHHSHWPKLHRFKRSR